MEAGGYITEQKRLEYLTVEHNAYKRFIFSYLNTHGLAAPLAGHADQLLKHDMCRRKSLHRKEGD